MDIDYQKLAIVVMDVCDPKASYAYFDEEKTNNYFVLYLNSRLKDLQSKGSKIIEINYLKHTHPYLDVNFDFITTNKDDLEKYLKEEKINHLNYTGFHYGVRTHFARELSSYNITDWEFLTRISISPFLTRALPDFYGDPITRNTRTRVEKISL